jgi:hypothetical protein
LFAWENKFRNLSEKVVKKVSKISIQTMSVAAMISFLLMSSPVGSSTIHKESKSNK